MTSKTFSAAEPHADARINALTALIPIAGIFAFFLVGIWLDGTGLLSRWLNNGEGPLLVENVWAVWSFSAWREVISGSENNIAILACAAAVGLTLAILCAYTLAKSSTATLLPATFAGARSSLLPLAILVLAWSITKVCESLGTGPFLVAAVGESVSPQFWPAITFVIAGLTAFSTGTSFATMLILIPIATPIAMQLEGGVYGPITIITLAAILDGSIFGDHCSPISDTTIMSSISSSSDHIHHVRTQLPYSLAVAALALCCGYIPAGFGLPSWVGIGIAVAIIACLFYFLPKNEPNSLPAPPSVVASSSK